jgi:hypothetical protein
VRRSSGADGEGGRGDDGGDEPPFESQAIM